MTMSPAQAQSNPALEEIIVTAQKREQNLQDIAVSVQVLDNQQLENLGVRSFEDFIDFMPTVSYSSAGPGFAKIYMRGIASGGDGNHSASMPSVGYYLDEQPVTTINQVLDIHMYDIARVETLSGPQGTLYGQGSQSGTIRIITNKPVMGETEYGLDFGASSVTDGGTGYDLNGFLNVPIGDRAAVRLVGWHKDVPGYIDLVDNEMTIDGPQPRTFDNFSFSRKDYNEAEVTGMRALLQIDLNDNWSLTPGVMFQNTDTQGTWEHNPDSFGDLETGTFWDAFAEDEWVQASLTYEGSIDDLDFVYAGAFLDRENVSEYDYSDYTQYISTFYAPTGCVYYDVNRECAIGTQYVGGFEKYERMSHEIRLQSDQDQSVRWVIGAFTQTQEHNFDLQWIVPDLDPADTVVLPPTGDRKYGGTTVWQTYQIREDQDVAGFGELYIDFAENFTATLGARYFDYENSLYGFNGFARHCTGQYGQIIAGVFVPVPKDEGGDFFAMPESAGGSMQYPCFDTRILDDVASGHDWVFKTSLEWRVNDDSLMYFTWSEGFRAGGVNRARVPNIPTYDPDYVTNYEIGWKTMLADGRLRFNGALYFVEWDDVQLNFLDFTVSNLTIVQNVGNSETTGLEWDLTYAVSDNNTLTFAGSYNDAELTQDFWRLDDERIAGEPANAPKGTPMPYVPELQMTGIWRSNFNLGSLPSFFQASAAYTGSRWNDLDTLNVPARVEMDAYTLLHLSAGIERDTWSLGLFISNATDERAEVDVADPGYGAGPGVAWTQNTTRPRTYSIRYSHRF